MGNPFAYLGVNYADFDSEKAKLIAVGLLIALLIHITGVITVAPPSIQTQIAQTQKSPSAYAYEQTAIVQARESPANRTQDEQAIRKLIREWAEVGFSPKDKTKEFKFQERLAKFYDSTPNRVVLHDNADPQMRIATSAEDYGKIWDGIFPKLRYLDNKVRNVHQVVIEDNLAVAVLSFDSTFIFSNGKKDVVPTLVTLVWRRTADGWKIIQEHGSALKPAKS